MNRSFLTLMPSTKAQNLSVCTKISKLLERIFVTRFSLLQYTEWVKSTVLLYESKEVSHLVCGIRFIQHDNGTTRMVIDHSPEVNDSVWQRSLSHDKCIALFIRLSHTTNTSFNIRHSSFSYGTVWFIIMCSTLQGISGTIFQSRHHSYKMHMKTKLDIMELKHGVGAFVSCGQEIYQTSTAPRSTCCTPPFNHTNMPTYNEEQFMKYQSNFCQMAFPIPQ